MTLHRPARGLAVAATVLFLASPASAQRSDPSASEIIDALRPKPGQYQPATRGIRPVPQQNAVPPASQPAAATPQATSPQATSPQAAPMAPPPVTTTPATPPAQVAAVPADAPAISLTVQFATGSAGLTDQARRVLDELGKALTSEDLRPYRFRIEGHTDTVGPAGLNQALSERRASAVRSYLTSNFGVETSRLVTVGLGQTQLAVPTADNVDEPRNRRVQIVNIGG